ncbi:MAG: NPCBM/NEW2 domain-containing protein [Planctomycetota bacterium]
MAAKQQKVRVEFMIALTLVVLAFGATRFLRTYRRKEQQQALRRTAEELEEYTQQILHREREQLEHFAEAERGRMRREATALLMQLRRLIERTDAAGGPSSSAQERTFKRIQRNFARLRAGEPAVFPDGEPFLRAYFSRTDGVLRPYGVCVPPGYERGRRYPLILRIFEAKEGGLDDFPPAACYGGAISVSAQYASAGPRSRIGERSVLDLVSDVKEAYDIAEGRVYLAARGGAAAAAWNLIAHHPDLFGGAVMFGSQAACLEPPLPAEGPFRKPMEYLAEAFCPINFAENLSQARIIILQNAATETGQLRRTRRLANRLRELQYDVEYLEFPLKPRQSFPEWTWQYAIASLLGKGPPDGPRRIRYRTAVPGRGGGWWLSVQGLRDPLRPGSVEARMDGRRAEIATENVAVLGLEPGKMPAEVERLELDGTALPVPTGGGAASTLYRADGRWQPADGPRMIKREGLSGPFSEVLSDPFVAVYGTQGEGLPKELSRAEAGRFADNWEATHGGRPRVKADSEVSEADVRDRNLLLFGGSAVNAVSARLAGDLPVRAEGREVLVGDSSYRGSDLGYLVCYPNPLNPERMVALVAGTTPAALYQAFQRFGLNGVEGYKWFDYAVFDRRSAGADSFLRVGLFNSRWQIAGEGADPPGWLAEGPVRDLEPQHFPSLSAPAAAEGDRVPLSDVRPSRIRQTAGAVAFNRLPNGRPLAVAGRTFPAGMAVAVPSTLEYEPGGAFRALEVTLGTPPGQAAGPVLFQVWGDGRLLDSRTVPGPGAPAENEPGLRVSLSGVRRMRLVTKLTGEGDRAAGEDSRSPVLAVWGAPTLLR